MKNITVPSRNQRRLSKLHLGDLSPEARRRLKWFDYYRDNGQNAAKTCRHFDISRATFYRWKKRYDPKNLKSLKDRSSRPKRCRQRQWSTADVLAVQATRTTYPRWGKDKLAVLLKKAGRLLSVSTVGRILGYLKRTGKLVEPLTRSLTRRRSHKRQYATRKPKEYTPTAPGDLVQIDTMDIRPEPGIVLKQFSTVDVVSRWSVPTVASAATARLASKALDALIERAPFTIRAIQIDGGSEFMGEFEEACKARGLQLFLLPPRSPKLNGRVERINRTFREEFYECSTADPTVAGFAPDLRSYEDTYNTIRPHQALGYLTPAEFLENYNRPPTPNQEDLSRTS